MQRLTSAQLFAAPKRAGKTKARLERAKLVIVAARERAAETAQQCAAQPSTMRPPTVLQRRRLVGRFSGKFLRGRRLSCWRDSGPSTSSSPCIASARSSEHDPPARPKRDAELKTGDEKRAAVAGGSKCETGRCQSPGRWFDAPINDRETLTTS